MFPFNHFRKTIKTTKKTIKSRHESGQLITMKFTFPDNLLYQSEVVWVEDCGRGIYRIGVTEFGQYLLDDVITVSLPDRGNYVEKGEPVVSIDAIEDNLIIKAPIGGKIVEVNEQLRNSPELINEEPYGEGWLIEIEIDNADDLDDLVDANEVLDLYQERLQREELLDEDESEFEEDYEDFEDEFDEDIEDFDEYDDSDYGYDDY